MDNAAPELSRIRATTEAGGRAERRLNRTAPAAEAQTSTGIDSAAELKKRVESSNSFFKILVEYSGQDEEETKTAFATQLHFDPKSKDGEAKLKELHDLMAYIQHFRKELASAQIHATANDALSNISASLDKMYQGKQTLDAALKPLEDAFIELRKYRREGNLAERVEEAVAHGVEEEKRIQALKDQHDKDQKDRQDGISALEREIRYAEEDKAEKIRATEAKYNSLFGGLKPGKTAAEKEIAAMADDINARGEKLAAKRSEVSAAETAYQAAIVESSEANEELQTSMRIFKLLQMVGGSEFKAKIKDIAEGAIIYIDRVDNDISSNIIELDTCQAELNALAVVNNKAKVYFSITSEAVKMALDYNQSEAQKIEDALNPKAVEGSAEPTAQPLSAIERAKKEIALQSFQSFIAGLEDINEEVVLSANEVQEQSLRLVDDLRKNRTAMASARHVKSRGIATTMTQTTALIKSLQNAGLVNSVDNMLDALANTEEKYARMAQASLEDTIEGYQRKNERLEDKADAAEKMVSAFRGASEVIVGEIRQAYANVEEVRGITARLGEEAIRYSGLEIEAQRPDASAPVRDKATDARVTPDVPDGESKPGIF